jgi:FAD/FMN-containing dehydrogenase
LVNGATPSAEGNEIVLSLTRMNKVRDLDVVNLTLTVDAGITLKGAQEAALAEDCALPLSMGSEGSAQIGGALSTNAGGNITVRYGNARDLVLGLEVVLPDGEMERTSTPTQGQHRLLSSSAFRRSRGHPGNHHGRRAHTRPASSRRLRRVLRSALGAGCAGSFHVVPGPPP